MREWNRNSIQQYIDNEVEESTTLEYKAADALAKSPGKKKEIAKDVSAMANTAGGIIIYGVSEHQNLPEDITPIDRTQFSREWLDQVITHNIRPLIEGFTIHPVDIEPGYVVYVVEIPQSTTAHQVTAGEDYRYYERLNFTTTRMEDYRIRDVMNRAKLPEAEVQFRLSQVCPAPDYCFHTLRATVRNTGRKVVNHFKLRFTFPYVGLELNPPASESFRLWDIHHQTGVITGHRIVYRSREVLFPEDEVAIRAKETYPGCFRYKIRFDEQEEWVEARRRSKSSLRWVLYADEMPPKRGEIPFSQLYSGQPQIGQLIAA
jgi:hypothetical protein